MTSFLYTTYSNTVKITDWNALTTLLNRFHFAVEPTVDEDTEQLSFRATNHPQSFDVSDPDSDLMWDTREFLEALQPLLADTLVVKCVEVQGHGDPAAFKWVVSPHGSVSIKKL